MRYLVEERFVVSVDEPGEESGKTVHHYVEATDPHEAFRRYIEAARGKGLGVTERPDGSLGATVWRGQRLFRIRVSEADVTTN